MHQDMFSGVDPEKEIDNVIAAWLHTQNADISDSQGMTRAVLIAQGEGLAFRAALEFVQKRNLCVWPLIGPKKCPFDAENDCA